MSRDLLAAPAAHRGRSQTRILQVDRDADVRYRRPRFEAFASANAVLTLQPEAEDTRRSSLTMGYVRLFPNRQRIFAQAAAEGAKRNDWGLSLTLNYGRW